MLAADGSPWKQSPNELANEAFATYIAQSDLSS